MRRPMEMKLIRHGQPAWVRDGLGVLDPVLTEDGHRQAQAVAEAARGWRHPPNVLWVSDAARAQQTAAPLAEALGLEARTLPWLTEIRLPPEWEGAPSDGIRHIFARLRNRSIEEWWDGVPGGESFRDFEARIRSNLTTSLAEVGVTARDREDGPPLFDVADTDVRLAVVAHGGTNSVIASLLLGLPVVPWSWERLVMAHASITRLKAAPLLGAHLFGLREHSDVAHIPADVRSR